MDYIDYKLYFYTGGFNPFFKWNSLEILIGFSVFKIDLISMIIRNIYVLILNEQWLSVVPSGFLRGVLGNWDPLKGTW